MNGEAARHLHAVDGPLFDRATGEPAEGAPKYPLALELLEQLATEIRMLERERSGARLRIAELERNREAESLSDPNRPKVEFLWAVWRKACHRRRPLHYADRERMSRAIGALGLSECIAAVAGAAYDPNHSKPRKNGRRDRYDDLELVFREYRHVHDFASRVPAGWEPDLDKLAVLGGVSRSEIEKWL